VVEAGESPAAAAHGRSTLLLRLGMGIFLTMNIMVFSYFFYSQEFFPTEAGAAAGEEQAFSLVSGVLSYLLLLLCTGVVALLGLPLLVDATGTLVAALRCRRLDLDVNFLALVGVFSAYGLSAWHTVIADTRLYYDTAAVILVLITLGGYLDSHAKWKATQATRRLLESLPLRAWIIRRSDVNASLERQGRPLPMDVAVDEVAVGDHVRVRPGERLPVDGRVIAGDSHLSEATREKPPPAP
jgi:Cu2+-exporting ATPase